MNANEREYLNSLAEKVIGGRPWRAAVACSLLAFACGCGPGAQAVSKAAGAKASGNESAAATASDWPVFRGNALATGVAEGELTDNPQLLWKYSVEKGAFEATPVVANGI